MEYATSSGAPVASEISVRELYSKLWQFAHGVRPQYVAAMAMLTASQVIKLFVPWLAAQAIDTVQVAGSGQLGKASLYIAAILGLCVASWVLHGPGRILERNVGLQVRQSVADALYRKLAALPLAWHEARHSGEVQHRTQQASRALFDFTQSQFIYIQSAVSIIGPLVALWLLSGLTGGLALMGYVFIVCVILRFDRALMRLARRENEFERRYTAGLLDFLGNISTVLSLRLQNASRALLSRRLAEVFKPLRRAILMNEAKWCAVDLLSAALTWTLIVVYAWQAHRTAGATGSALMLGGLFMVFQYAQQAGSVIVSLASNFQSFARMRTDFASADPIWEATARAEAPVAPAPVWHQIESRGLTFVYTRGDGHAGGVRDATLTLRRGERIALVGSSGAGKSTLLRLFAGLYDPQQGYYQVDGDSGFALRSLAAVATLIPQEAEVFEASVRDNLTFGTPHSTESVYRAAYASAFDSVIDALPQGLDTPISERGFNLSGGQRQRLALARGLLAADRECGHDSSLLLLDEPTSALDQATETRIFKRLRECRPDACIVASVHRMSLLAHFDRVVLMRDGAVVDCGTVAELVARQPLMRELMGRAEPPRQAPAVDSIPV